MTHILSAADIETFNQKIRKLSNGARFEEAYALSLKLTKMHPDVPMFAYFEAVFSAEDETGFTPAQIKVRHASAARKLKKLLPKIRLFPPKVRPSLRNEYYWFSRQPYKQYRLGVEGVKKGEPRSHYSQGVGAVYLAKRYAAQGKKGLFLRWAKRSDDAWLEFFKDDSNWFNCTSSNRPVF